MIRSSRNESLRSQTNKSTDALSLLGCLQTMVEYELVHRIVCVLCRHTAQARGMALYLQARRHVYYRRVLVHNL